MDSQRGDAAVSGDSGSASDMKRILILGGTTEARRLAERLAHRTDLAVTLSLASRTALAGTAAGSVRVGGFGGAAASRHGEAQTIDLLIDATPSYAAQISANAAEATRLLKVPLLALDRPAWIAAGGDRWTEVPDVPAAVQALGSASRRAFLALGATSWRRSPRRLAFFSSAASIRSSRGSRFRMRPISRDAARSRPTNVRSSHSIASTSSSPRTAVAPRPTARSRRRAASACP